MYSVSLEHPSDLIANIAQALNEAQPGKTSPFAAPCPIFYHELFSRHCPASTIQPLLRAKRSIQKC
jgi:hypothetical protein